MSMAYLALRDKRLEGGVPARLGLHIVNTDGSHSLSSAFRSIRAASSASRGINTMFILCHGYAGSSAVRQQSGDFGGMGLELGREGVFHRNVSMWEDIKGSVSNIVVYSCGAADTQDGAQGTTADGQYLMGALAIHTNATVYAADRIQWYSTYNNLKNGRYDFGAWEGTLYCFLPDGTPALPISRPPVELSDVFFGRAP
ncbi:MAG: hypothetical protein R2684_14105 [Pyrinomonadaceae bacterium]